MVNKRQVWVYADDFLFFRKEFAMMLDKRFPELSGMEKSDAFKFHKIITALKGEWEM